MIAPIIQALASIFPAWIDRRGRIKEAETAAKIENAGKVIENAGWKDEYVVLIWSIPAIMAFVPGAQEFSEAGFANLAKAPEWYIIGWVSISLAIYGIKPAAKKIVEWRKDTQREKSVD